MLCLAHASSQSPSTRPSMTNMQLLNSGGARTLRQPGHLKVSMVVRCEGLKGQGTTPVSSEGTGTTSLCVNSLRANKK